MNALQQKTLSWRNTLATALGLNKETFQLIQGSLSLGSTSKGLYEMADSIPPNSPNYQFSSSQWNRFSEDYRILLYSLNAGSNTNELQQILGDNYTRWIEFKNDYYKNNETSNLSQQEVFNLFADRELGPNVAQSVKNEYIQSAMSPLDEAMKRYQNKSNFLEEISPSGEKTSTPIYSKTIQQVQTAIKKSEKLSISYNSVVDKTTTTGSFSQVAAGGFWGFFGAGASAAHAKLAKKISDSDIRVEGTINGYTTIPIGPGAWFDSGVFKTALVSPDDDYVWDANKSESWNTFFGAKGSMQNIITELILVEGLDLKITIKNTSKDVNLEAASQAAGGGFWPFYGAEGSNSSFGVATSIKDNELTIPYKTNIGDITVLGANVKPIKSWKQKS